MHRLLIIIVACILVLALPVAADESIAVVTQRTSPLKSVSLETLKQVFLRKSLIDNKGSRWIPLNLPINDELRQNFSLALFNKLPEDQENYWNEQYFHGIDPPQVLASEEAVLRFVEITPGAIGYVHKHNVHERVKILKTLATPGHN
jgi:hypothetical protein